MLNVSNKPFSFISVCKDPPYKVEESGYAGFILPIEVYFRNKEEPKKVRFDYDLFLHLEGHPPVNHLRCEKLTFNNPTEEFRRKLLKAGGTRDPHKRGSEESKQVMVMQEGSTSLFSQHLKLPTLPNNSLTSSSSDPKKSKSFHTSKDCFKGGRTDLLTTATTTSTNTSSFSKLHKPSKDHKEKPLKDLKDPKSAFRDSSWESSKVPKESSRKPKENQPLRDSNPKMGFKEPKSLSKDHRSEGLTHGSGLNKRLSTLDSDDLMTKKRRKGHLESSAKQMSGSDSHYSDKKRLQMGTSKLRPDLDEAERRKVSRLPPFQELVDPNDSDMEDQSKSDVSRAPYRSTLWSDSFRKQLFVTLSELKGSEIHVTAMTSLNHHPLLVKPKREKMLVAFLGVDVPLNQTTSRKRIFFNGGLVGCWGLGWGTG
ncbi:hypothetical protein AMECASPLE_015069 [Ameca splendens]|uniref:YEATS domain-containing protein n=1 Tax=Ameca splendens TaxID=208324 RepID=A0ABV0XQM9_9TELE